MVALTYPGVYIQEVPSGVRTITGVSTSTALFIGRTERGVMDKPTRVFNYTEFANQFGTSTALSELATQVRLFFANGGQQAYIMRIAKGAEKASVTLKNIAEANVLKLVAREAGERGGELRASVDYATPTPGSTFNLRLFRTDQATLQESELEVHTNLSMQPGSPRYVVDVLAQGSQLVTASKEIGASTDDGYVLGARVIAGVAEAALADVLPGEWTLRLEVDGTVHPLTIIDGEISGELPAGCALSFETVVAATSSLVKITKTDGSVRALPSGTANDAALALQLLPALGAVESSHYASQRPAPSGLFADGRTNIGKIAAFDQAAHANFDITAAGQPLTGFNLQTAGANKFFKGLASPLDSLLNVREKLELLASQFNAKAQVVSNFNWRLEVQGLFLVFRPTAGVANQGLGATVSATVANFFDDTNGIKIPVDNARYYTVGAGGNGDYQGGLPGLNGDRPELGEYNAAFEVIDREVDIFNLLILPRDADAQESHRSELWGPASIFCQRRRAFLLVDPPSTWASTADVSANIPSLRIGLVKDHSAIYWPRLQAVNEHGLIKAVDPTGAIAGIMARTDGNRGVWKAPAGLEADVRGITGVERAVSDPENGVTNALAVNTIRVFPNGIVSWGARTIDGFDNSGNDDYKYVSVRRLALFLAESLRRGLQFAVFEPNDEPLWAQIRLAAGAFMNGLFRQGAFQGQKKSDAYFVKVDSETTTQNDINLGIVNVIVGFAPLKPAEFVVVHLKQIAGQIQT